MPSRSPGNGIEREEREEKTLEESDMRVPCSFRHQKVGAKKWARLARLLRARGYAIESSGSVLRIVRVKRDLERATETNRERRSP